MIFIYIYIVLNCTFPDPSFKLSASCTWRHKDDNSDMINWVKTSCSNESFWAKTITIILIFADYLQILPNDYLNSLVCSCTREVNGFFDLGGYGVYNILLRHDVCSFFNSNIFSSSQFWTMPRLHVCLSSCIWLFLQVSLHKVQGRLAKSVTQTK